MRVTCCARSFRFLLLLRIGLYRYIFLQHRSTFPLLNGQPNVMLFGFALADVILVGLCIWDWRSHRRLNVFPIALVVLLAYHYQREHFLPVSTSGKPFVIGLSTRISMIKGFFMISA